MAGWRDGDAAVDGSTGLAGRPGVRWRNWTSWPWYQIQSSLIHPCHVCIALHGSIRPKRWPLPIHTHCECVEHEIPPGGESPFAWVSPASLFQQLDEAAKIELVGRQAVQLLRAGLVSLTDIVGEDDWSILTFVELVARRGLTVAQLEAAGIDTAAAERAVGTGPLTPAAGPVR